MAVFHDITQLKKLEQARKDFVANISHEIKTPITAIMGFAETLLEGALDDRPHAEKFLETIRLNSERINSLVDDLMTISKIELGVIKVEKAPLIARQVLQQVVDTLGKKASIKSLALSLDLQAGPVEIEADRDRLLQIVTNLVDNAIKFTEQGSVTIGMSTEGGRPLLVCGGHRHRHCPEAPAAHRGAVLPCRPRPVTEHGGNGARASRSQNISSRPMDGKWRSKAPRAKGRRSRSLWAENRSERSACPCHLNCTNTTALYTHLTFGSFFGGRGVSPRG